jgi:shikimate dehydrogenase
MLGLMKRNPGVLWVSMGPCATFTRVLAPIFGVPWTYAALEESLATDKGQLTLREMREVYGVHRLTPKTKIYGLIGGCVAQSIGHCVHNAVFRECGVDAVYVKMNVEKEELSRFLNGAAELGIRGLSVTTPLKETVGILPQVNRVSCSGAINTLLFRSDGIFGYNTDGQAALDALEAKHGSVHGQKVVVLGAGGAARAIVVEACRRGASVTVLNRNFHRARECIRDAPAERGLLSLLPRLDYDVLIQATSATESPVPLEAIRPGVTAMEIITSPQETQFVQFAKQRGSKIVLGGEMFVLQAMGQYAIWFRNPNVDAAKRVFIAEMERRL